MSLKELKHELGIGAIVAVPTRLGQRIGKEEMIAAALRVWPQAAIEEALGEVTVLPEAIRLVELRARIPRYQRDMLRVLAEWQETTVDEVLTRELEGVASSYADDLAGAVPDFRLAMRWPARGAETAE